MCTECYQFVQYWYVHNTHLYYECTPFISNYIPVKLHSFQGNFSYHRKSRRIYFKILLIFPFLRIGFYLVNTEHSNNADKIRTIALAGDAKLCYYGNRSIAWNLPVRSRHLELPNTGGKGRRELQMHVVGLVFWHL